MLASLLAATAIAGAQTTPPSPPAPQADDVRCFQALGFRFAALPAERDRTTALLSFYAGRISARSGGWLTEVLRPPSPAMSKDTYAPIAEACRKRAVEIMLPVFPAAGA